MPATLLKVYQTLLSAYGPQHWWPGESRCEIVVGAILTQNTSWKNVERRPPIANLREAEMLSPERLFALPPEELAELIRPAGYFRRKTACLRNFLAYLMNSHNGSLDAMFRCELPTLREELLCINGIGPETADSMLLYAGGFPTFVVDTYTTRVLKRHGWIEPEADYHAIKEHFEFTLEPRSDLFNEFHALIVQVGKQHCGPQPKCEGCPLESLLPSGGMAEL